MRNPWGETGRRRGLAAGAVVILVIAQIPVMLVFVSEIPAVPHDRILRLNGAPEDMWHQFGASEKRAVRENLDLFLKQMAGANLSRTELEAKALEAARYLPADFLREVKALADGAGVAFPELLAMNLQGDEAYWGDECTLVLAAGSGSVSGNTLASKNRDYVVSGAQVLVLMQPASGYSFMGIMTAGQAGISMGLNEKGLSIQDTQLPVPTEDKTGYSGYTIMERVMETCSNVDSAVSYIANATKHSGITYSIADHEKGAFVETVPSSYSPNISVQFVNDGLAVHTNHYMYEPFRDWVINDSFGSMNPASFARYDRAVALASGAGGGISPELLMTICRDLKDFRVSDRESVIGAHPEVPRTRWSGGASNCSICNDLTIASSVMDIDRQYPELLSTMWAAFGNPSFSPFVPIHNGVLGNMSAARETFAQYADGRYGKESMGLQKDGRYRWGALDSVLAGWEDKVRQAENSTRANATGELRAGNREKAVSELLSDDALSARNGLNLLRSLGKKQIDYPVTVPSAGAAGLIAAIGLGCVSVYITRRKAACRKADSERER